MLAPNRPCKLSLAPVLQGWLLASPSSVKRIGVTCPQSTPTILFVRFVAGASKSVRQSWRRAKRSSSAVSRVVRPSSWPACGGSSFNRRAGHLRYVGAAAGAPRRRPALRSIDGPGCDPASRARSGASQSRTSGFGAPRRLCRRDSRVDQILGRDRVQRYARRSLRPDPQ